MELIVIAFLILMLGIGLGFRLGFRYGLEKGRADRTWLVRPHTKQTMEEIFDPEVQGSEATVVDADYARTNLPGSNSKFV